MSKSGYKMRNFLLHLEEELRDYAKDVKSCSDDGEISALLFMENVAGEIRAFFTEANAY